MDGKGWIKKDVGREKEGHWKSHELIMYNGVFWRVGRSKGVWLDERDCSVP